MIKRQVLHKLMGLLVLGCLVLAPSLRAQNATELEQYLQQLSSEHGHERQAAFRWLSSHPELSRGPLHAVLRSDASNWTKEGALQTLALMPDASDIPLFTDWDSGKELHFQLMHTLAVNPDPSAFDLLARHVQDHDEEGAGDALACMGYSKDPRARKFLEDHLHTKSATLRWKVVHGLSLLGIEGSRAALEACLRVERDREVKAKIKEVLN